MTEHPPAHHESDPRTHKLEQGDQSKAKPQAKPTLNVVGGPEPEVKAPVDRFQQPDRPIGERQDEAGAAPRSADRNDAVPAGTTRARRTGSGQGGPDQGQPEEPDAAHRGQPARFRTGEAEGSGASAGGTRHGAPEDPATDSAAGAGHERGLSADRD